MRERLAWLFYSGVPWEKLTVGEQRAFEDYLRASAPTSEAK